MHLNNLKDADYLREALAKIGRRATQAETAAYCERVAIIAQYKSEDEARLLALRNYFINNY